MIKHKKRNSRAGRRTVS